MRRDKESPVVVVEKSEGGIGSFFWGAVIGAGLALLFAPQSGEETRHDIHERGNELREEIEQVTNEARRRVEGESIDEAMQYGKAEARKYQETARYR